MRFRSKLLMRSWSNPRKVYRVTTLSRVTVPLFSHARDLAIRNSTYRRGTNLAGQAFEGDRPREPKQLPSASLFLIPSYRCAQMSGSCH